MPIKKLSQAQIFAISDIMDEYYQDDDIYYEDMIDKVNHYFAKIYGYKRTGRPQSRRSGTRAPPKKRTLSAWNKFVKANSNKKKFQFRDGKLKLKQMGIAYRKTRAYKQNKKRR